MKKNVVSLAALVLSMIFILISVTSCSEVREFYDFEKYMQGKYYGLSEVRLTSVGDLVPDETFVESFEYLTGGIYYYRYTEIIVDNHWEKALLYIGYEAETYQAAKQYCLEHWNLWGETEYSYQDYCFIQTPYFGHYVNDEGIRVNGFPNMFTMFCYNDRKSELIFIGLYLGLFRRGEADIALTDWGAFLKLYYSEYYDFDT